jgi:hypothetical protein
MGLIQLVAILLVIGALIWLVETAPFVSPSMKPIIRWVIIAVVVLWLITLFVGDVPILPLRRR